MPWPSNHVPKYRKHRRSGQAIVTLNGVDHYLGPHGTKASKVEYDRLVHEWLAAGRHAAKASGDDSPTVSVVIASYWRHAKAYYVKNGKETSEVGAIRNAVRPLKELYGKTPAAEFGPLALKAVRSKYIANELSRGTVNQNVGRIVRMFRWAAEHEQIPASVPQALSMIAGLRKNRTAAKESKPILPIDDATVDATLKHLPKVVADMVKLQRLTGARPSEVCNLRPMDVDKSKKVVWLYRPESHKTEHHDRGRIIFIGPKAQAILKPYLKRDRDAYCFRPVESEEQRRAAQHAKRKTPLRQGNSPGTNRKRKPARPPGEQYTTASYRRAIERACDLAFPHAKLSGLPACEMTDKQKADLKKWRKTHRWAPNRLRHTAATEVRREFGLERVLKSSLWAPYEGEHQKQERSSSRKRSLRSCARRPANWLRRRSVGAAEKLRITC